MDIYDPIADALDIRPIYEFFPDYNDSEIPEDSSKGAWSNHGRFRWTRKNNGPMQAHHKNTWKGDDRTEAQKRATEKWKENYKSFLKTPTAKGEALSESHKQALRVPRPGVGRHGNQAKGDSHFAKQILTCPHCGKQGGGGSMKRWHFDACKSR